MMEKFTVSGWAFLSIPAQQWLAEKLIKKLSYRQSGRQTKNVGSAVNVNPLYRGWKYPGNITGGPFYLWMIFRIPLPQNSCGTLLNPKVS